MAALGITSSYTLANNHNYNCNTCAYINYEQVNLCVKQPCASFTFLIRIKHFKPHFHRLFECLSVMFFLLSFLPSASPSSPVYLLATSAMNTSRN